MMKVILDSISKRFSRHWVFRDVGLVIESGGKYAVTGPNGSGKSTFLKILCGAMPASKGKVTYVLDGKAIIPEKLPAHLSFAAPYTDLIGEFTLPELFAFHSGFKTMARGLSEYMDFAELLEYPFKPGVQIRNYSSGMRQRVRLALAICSRSDLLLLDEPGSNLDTEGRAWYARLLEKFTDGRTVCVASNDASDYSICNSIIDVRELSGP